MGVARVMPPAATPRLRRAFAPALIAAILVACGSTGPSILTPGASQVPSAALPSGVPTSGPDTSVGPGASGAPLATPPAPATIPEPTLTDPYDISSAFWEPERIADGIVSLLNELEIGIYTADGTPVRPGAERGPLDPWLTEDEVRGLIALGEDDAAALAAGETLPMTLGDLARPLAELSGSTAAEILARYDDAYFSAEPQPLMGQVASVAFREDEPVNRALLWFLLLDGVVGTEAGSASLDVAAIAPMAPPRRIEPTVDLPFIPSPVPGLSADEFALLLVHLPLAGFAIPFEMVAGSIAVHEGHDGPGTPATIAARYRPMAVPLVSPFGGTVLLQPASVTDLTGVVVTWADGGILGRHGTALPPFGAPTLTDALGESSFRFEPMEEEAGGVGDLDVEAGSVIARVAVVDLMRKLYVLPPAVWGLISGDRIALGVVSVERHRETAAPGDWKVTLSGARPGAGSYAGTVDEAYCWAPPSGSARSWGATARPPSGTIRLIDVSLDSGHVSIGVLTEFAFDTPIDWFNTTDTPMVHGTVRTIPASPTAGDIVTIIGDIAWTDGDPPGPISIHVEVTCGTVPGLEQPVTP